jgi:hypothetical protein
LRAPIQARVESFSQLLTRANESELKSQAGSAYRVVKQRKAGAPDTIRTCDLCLRRAKVGHSCEMAGRCSAAAAGRQLSCKGVKIFYQDGRGKTFSTSLEVGRNKSWAETTCYKSDTCPFVSFGIECASQDRTNPWPTGVLLDGSKGALPSRPSPSPPQAQKPSNNQQSSRELTSIGRRAQCGVITADYRTLIRVASA